MPIILKRNRSGGLNKHPDAINIWEGEAPAEPKRRGGSLALPNDLNGYLKTTAVFFDSFSVFMS